MEAAKFEIDGNMMTIREIARKYDIPEATIRARVMAGKQGEQLITASKKGGTGASYVIDGKSMTVRQISREYGINEATLRARIMRGWSGNQLIADAGARVSSELQTENELLKKLVDRQQQKIEELQAELAKIETV